MSNPIILVVTLSRAEAEALAKTVIVVNSVGASAGNLNRDAERDMIGDASLALAKLQAEARARTS